MLKIFIIIILVLFLLFIIPMALFANFLIINKKELSPNEVIIKGNKNKKALILYQKSKHESATEITNELAKALNADGYSVTINHPSSKINYNIEDYDIIAFGSTVYMGTIAEPLIKYMKKISFKNKNVILYLIGSAPESELEINILKNLVNESKSMNSIKIKKGETETIKTFAEKLLKDII